MSNGVIGSSERSKMSSVPRRPERLAPPAGPEALGTALRPGQASLATALGVAGSAACAVPGAVPPGAVPGAAAAAPAACVGGAGGAAAASASSSAERSCAKVLHTGCDAA